jgi:hypothetical protein
MSTIDNDKSQEPSRMAVERDNTENALKKEWGYEYFYHIHNPILF